MHLYPVCTVMIIMSNRYKHSLQYQFIISDFSSQDIHAAAMSKLFLTVLLLLIILINSEVLLLVKCYGVHTEFLCTNWTRIACEIHVGSELHVDSTYPYAGHMLLDSANNLMCT